MSDISLAASSNQFAKLIDHTNLKPFATSSDIKKLCEEAIKYGFGAVCVSSRWASFARAELAARNGSVVRVCSVVGFPHGDCHAEAKVIEAISATKDGAVEIDMVQAIGAIKERDKAYAFNDVRRVVDVAHTAGAIVKVILETAWLTDAEIKFSCDIAVEAGADFVKTSTGFAKAPVEGREVGATVDVVEMMSKIVAPEVGVKASAGIGDLATVRAMVAAGATRIGASNSVNILRELESHA
jgi:deoxyribose-phosphate aldolase